MSTTNRGWNRFLLAAIGLAWLVVAAGIACWALGIDLLALRPSWLERIVIDPAIVACVAAVIGLLTWALHLRFAGKGRTDDAVQGASVVLDRKLVADVLEHELRHSPDVLSSNVDVWRDNQGALSWRVTIETRKSGDLAELLSRTSEALSRTAARVGAAPKAVVHVRSGIRSAIAGARRAR